MLIKEILTENFTSVLYHASDFKGAIGILKSGHWDTNIFATGDMGDAWYHEIEKYTYHQKTGKPRVHDRESLRNKYKRQLSFSRTRLSGFAHDKLGGGWKSDTGNGVVFQVDGDWLSRHYKNVPVDSWGFDRLTHWPEDYKNEIIGNSEAEDRLYTNAPTVPITPIVAAHIIADKKHAEEANEFIKIAYARNIPVLYYKTIGDLQIGRKFIKNPNYIDGETPTY